MVKYGVCLKCASYYEYKSQCDSEPRLRQLSPGLLGVQLEIVDI